MKSWINAQIWCIYWIVHTKILGDWERRRETMTVRATFDTYETILSAYDYFNTALFGGQLPEVI